MDRVGDVIEMTGGFLSTMKGPTGPAVVQLPGTSQTLWVLVKAEGVSVPAGTDVVSVKLASPGLASPESASKAVQEEVWSVACQTESGTLQLTTGGVSSIWTAWNFGDSWLPQLSVAWNWMVDTPSFCRPMKATELK